MAILTVFHSWPSAQKEISSSIARTLRNERYIFKKVRKYMIRIFLGETLFKDFWRPCSLETWWSKCCPVYRPSLERPV